MKNFYNRDKISIEKKDKYFEKTFELNVPELYGITFFEDLDNKIQSFIQEITSNHPTMINIVGDFDVLQEATKEDIEDFIEVIVALFIDAIHLKDKKISRDRKTSLTKLLIKSKLTISSKNKIINFETRLPIFNIEVYNKKEEILYSVF